MAVAAVAVLLVGCSSDGDDEAAVDAGSRATTGDTAAAGTAPSGTAGSGGGGGSDGCPSTTTLTAVTEPTYGDPEEIVPSGTEFPAGHFTLDLDGSGYGPELTGVLSTDPSADVEALSTTSPDQPTGGQKLVVIRLAGPPEGATEFPLGVYDVTYEDGKVDATEGMGLEELDVLDGESERQAANFTELELTHVGDGMICGTFTPVDRSDETSQAPTHLEGEFVAEYSEQP